MGVVFGKTKTNIMYDKNDGTGVIELKKYNYFDGSPNEFYLNVFETDIYHIKEADKSRFICKNPYNKNEFLEIVKQGTGFSTDIPPFNPSDILRNLLKMLNGDDPDEMIPWFKGFKGTIKGNDGKIYSIGKYEIIDESNIKITELPVGTWTDKYKEFLESIMMNDKNDKSPSHIVTKYQNLSSNNTIDFTVTFAGNHLQNLI